MTNRKTITKRASYRDGVRWIAFNDNASDHVDPSSFSGAAQREIVDRIAGYISTLLLADIFGADPDCVAVDIFIERQKYIAAKKESA